MMVQMQIPNGGSARSLSLVPDKRSCKKYGKYAAIDSFRLQIRNGSSVFICISYFPDKINLQ